MSEKTYKIKPLVWKQDPVSQTPYFRAFALSVGYVVLTERNGKNWWEWYGPDEFGDSETKSTPCDSIEAGKAACQQDWARRLSEALIPIAEDGGETCEGCSLTFHPKVMKFDYDGRSLCEPCFDELKESQQGGEG